MSYYATATYTNLCANPATQMAYLNTNYGASFKTACQEGPHASGAVTSGSPFATMTTEQVKMAQAALCAFECKPYGSSSAWTLSELCAAAALSCAQFVKFALELYNEISSYASNAPKLMTDGVMTTNTSYDSTKPTAWAIGWNGGNIGNHCQIIFYDPANTSYPYMLIDPTFGLFVMGLTLDSVTRGTTVATNNMVSWFESWDSDTKSNIASQQVTNKSVIAAGTCKATDILYAHPGLSNFTQTGSSNSPTWQAWVI